MQREGFVLLYDIGVISQEILSFKRQARELPKEIKQLTSDITAMENKIEKNKSSIEKFENDINEAALVREDIKSSLKKAEEKVPSISNNDEYDNVYKEISNFKGKIKSLSNKITVMEDDKEALETDSAELMEALESQKEELSPEIQAKQKDLDSLEAKIKEKKSGISELLVKLEEAAPSLADIYKRMDKISNGSVSIGFVDIQHKSSHCSHCFSILPLQQKTKIRDAEEVVICENCSSILVSTEFASEPAES